MGEEEYAQVVQLVTPDQISMEQLNQHSVLEHARSLLSILLCYDSVRSKLEELGVKFKGRVFLAGSPGTDFQTFLRHICLELKMKAAILRINQVLGSDNRTAQAIRVGFEYAHRNAPCLFFIDKLDVLCFPGTLPAVVFQNEIKNTTWSDDKILVVACTTRPEIVDTEVLSYFDQTFVTKETSFEDRVRVFDHILKQKPNFDSSLVAELTEGWTFRDVNHLATNLCIMAESGKKVTREKMEEMISSSGVFPIGSRHYLDMLVENLHKKNLPSVDTLEQSYPDDFLDQLYLSAVGDDYAGTQNVVEALNQGSPLTTKDQRFLARYPFLLTGDAEERLTRLIRAKKSNDRLKRIMGR